MIIYCLINEHYDYFNRLIFKHRTLEFVLHKYLLCLYDYLQTINNFSGGQMYDDYGFENMYILKVYKKKNVNIILEKIHFDIRKQTFNSGNKIVHYNEQYIDNIIREINNISIHLFMPENKKNLMKNNGNKKTKATRIVNNKSYKSSAKINLDKFSVDKKNFEAEDNNLYLLKNEIDIMNEKLNTSKNKIMEMETVYQTNKKELNDDVKSLNDKKRDRKNKLEKEKQNKNQFESDIKCYFKIKKDVENDKMKESDISPFYEHKYLIFKMLEEQQLISENMDMDSAYNNYADIIKEVINDNEIQTLLNERIEKDFDDKINVNHLFN